MRAKVGPSLNAARPPRRFEAKPREEPAIAATPERMRKAGDHVEKINVDHEQGRHHNTVRLLDGSPIDMLAKRGAITGDQYQAAVRIYADWYQSGFAHSGVLDPGKPFVDGGGRSEPTDQRLDAAQRYNRAIKALGPVHMQPIHAIVINGYKVADYGHSQFGYRHPKKAGLAALTALRLALDQLDLHYYGRDDRRRGRMRYGQMTDDGRPTEINVGVRVINEGD